MGKYIKLELSDEKKMKGKIMISIILGGIYGIVLTLAILMITKTNNPLTIYMLGLACIGFGIMLGRLVASCRDYRKEK